MLSLPSRLSHRRRHSRFPTLGGAGLRITTLPIEDPRWREFTSRIRAPAPSICRPGSLCIAECYGFDAFVLAVCDTDGEILAGAPTVAVRSPFGRLRWVSLPFTDACPLLVRPDTAVRDVVAALGEYAAAGRAHELEVRASLPASDGVYPLEVGYSHVLELPSDPADLHPRRAHRLRRNQANRRGVEVTYGNTAQDVAAFYRAPHAYATTAWRSGPTAPILRSGSGSVARAWERLPRDRVAWRGGCRRSHLPEPQRYAHQQVPRIRSQSPRHRCGPPHRLGDHGGGWHPRQPHTGHGSH